MFHPEMSLEKAAVDESELLNAVASGDQRAFKRLFDIHILRVYSLCLRIIGNPDDAQDVAQNVFFTLWKKAGSIRGECKLSTWLYRVAMNNAINFRRQGGLLSRMREVFSLDGEGEGDSGSLVAPDQWRPDRQYQRKQAEIELADLLSRLPRRQREVFLLHKLEGLSCQEIATELSLTLSSVESLLHRAKINLQKTMLKTFRKKSASELPTDMSKKRMEEGRG